MAVIILNWNSAADTASAVKGLPPSWLPRVIVVDNGSDSWSRELETLGLIPGLTVVRRPENGGYAAGMNTGMKAAAAKGLSYAALVNADARPNGDSLERMLALTDRFAVVGTAQRGPQGRYTTAAIGRGVFPRSFDCGGCGAGHHQVDVVSGATILVSLVAAEAIGWMDESYFHYAEEVDLCIRVRRAGGLVGWSCSTVVDHAVGGSMPHSSASAHYYTARNKILLVRNNRIRVWASPRLASDELRFAFRAYRDGQLRAWVTGVSDGLGGTVGRWSP